VALFVVVNTAGDDLMEHVFLSSVGSTTFVEGWRASISLAPLKSVSVQSKELQSVRRATFVWSAWLTLRVWFPCQRLSQSERPEPFRLWLFALRIWIPSSYQWYHGCKSDSTPGLRGNPMWVYYFHGG
jgi:hypothetical protein